MSAALIQPSSQKRAARITIAATPPNRLSLADCLEYLGSPNQRICEKDNQQHLPTISTTSAHLRPFWILYPHAQPRHDPLQPIPIVEEHPLRVTPPQLPQAIDLKSHPCPSSRPHPHPPRWAFFRKARRLRLLTFFLPFSASPFPCSSTAFAASCARGSGLVQASRAAFPVAVADVAALAAAILWVLWVLSMVLSLGVPLASLGRVFCAGGAVEVGGVADGAECGCGVEWGGEVGSLR